ncbi:hypothetical protein BMS3Abin14_01739 [bacterium BMS3Abin14]|nr:hypothetical protein BMS3Abin14_01739 [bacterium BMS3Abin14]
MGHDGKELVLDLVGPLEFTVHLFENIVVLLQPGLGLLQFSRRGLKLDI